MVNPIWFIRNVFNCASIAVTPADFGRLLTWTYVEKLPNRWRRNSYTVRLQYPDPIGHVTLTVRANHGSDAFIQGEVFHHRYYELPLLAAPPTILDLGANAGFTAIYFSRRYPEAKIAVVEPVPDNLRVLKENLQLNSIEAEVFASAVSVKDGFVTMELGPSDYGHKVVDTHSGEISGFDLIRVEALTVPSLMDRLGWGRIGLLKVDIEGYENQLFRHSCEWLDLVDAMCIECHEGFGIKDLEVLANCYGFKPPQELPGIWLLRR